MWLIVPFLALVLLALLVAGLVAALVAAATVVVFIIVHALPFLLILFGAWLLFRPGRRRHVRHDPDAPRSAPPAGPSRRSGPHWTVQSRPDPPQPSAARPQRTP